MAVFISESLFIGLLGFTLLLSGLRLLFQIEIQNEKPSPKRQHPLIPPIIGGGIGFIAGLVGIGGGIFLAPILYFMKWGTARQIAAACCLFIFVNSISGLFGQLSKLNETDYISLIIKG